MKLASEPRSPRKASQELQTEFQLGFLVVFLCGLQALLTLPESHFSPFVEDEFLFLPVDQDTESKRFHKKTSFE